MLETVAGLVVAQFYQELMVFLGAISSSIAAFYTTLTYRNNKKLGDRDQRRDQEVSDIYGRLSRLENNQVWTMVMIMVGFFTLFFVQLLSLLCILLWPEEGRWLGSIVKAFCINRPLVALMFFVSIITGVTICGSKFVSFLRRHMSTPGAASPPADGPVPTPGGDTTPGRRSPVTAVLAGCLGVGTTDRPELFKNMAITLASGQDGNGKAIEFVRKRMDKKRADVDRAIQVLQEVGQTTHRLNSDAQ